MDLTEGIKVSVGNWGYLAEGNPRTAWITLPKTDEEIQEFLTSSGLIDANHEEIYISEYEGGTPFGCDELFNEFTRLEDLNIFAKECTLCDYSDIDAIDAWVKNDVPDNFTGLLNIGYWATQYQLPFRPLEYDHGTPMQNFGWTMADLNEDLHALLISDPHVEQAFNYEEYGKDLIEQGDYVLVGKCFAYSEDVDSALEDVFTRDELHEKFISNFEDKNPEKQAFAVYSADDWSLSFYNRVRVPAEGTHFNGKIATKIYPGIEDTNFTVPWFNYCRTIDAVSIVDEGIKPKCTANWFRYFENLYKIEGLNKLDVSGVADMSNMFQECSSLTSLDLSDWNTASLVYLSGIFSDCASLTSIDISGWETAETLDAQCAFADCTSLKVIKGISDLDVSDTRSMRRMFDNCSSLTNLDLSNWDVDSCTDMRNMFRDCPNLTSIGDLSNWNLPSRCWDQIGDFKKAVFNYQEKPQVSLSDKDNALNEAQAHKESERRDIGSHTTPTGLDDR